MPYDWKELPGAGIAGGNAIIHPTATIGERAYIGHGVVIHAGVQIGDNVSIESNSVIGRYPRRPGAEVHVPAFTIIGDGAVIGATVVIYAGTHIGRRALIGDGAKLREYCDIGDDCIVGSNCTFQKEVVMQKGSRVIDLSHITNGVFIGKDAFVSTGVLTMDDDSFNGLHDADRTLRAPVIGEGASIGGGAILLPGVNIGPHAVVGSGAVVTRDVAINALVMGIPARERHDLGRDGTPGVPSHEQLGRNPITEFLIGEG